MKKRIIMIAAAAALSVLMAFPAFAGTWKDVNGRWRYQRGAEKYASQEWLNPVSYTHLTLPTKA